MVQKENHTLGRIVKLLKSPEFKMLGDRFKTAVSCSKKTENKRQQIITSLIFIMQRLKLKSVITNSFIVLDEDKKNSFAEI